MGNDFCCRPEPEFKSQSTHQSRHNDEIYQDFMNEAQTMDITDSSESKVSLRDFILLGHIGSGGYGKVLLVEHNQTQLKYAMKAIKKSSLTKERHIRRAKDERIILEKIQSPFIVKYLQSISEKLKRLEYAFQTKNKLYLVTELCVGGDLSRQLYKQRRFTLDVVKFYAAEIFLGLKALHKKTIVYRDLKPENIVLDLQGHIKLIDFGLSKIQQDRERAESKCGTLAYMAPEVLSTQSYDSSCDWWSFGAIIYEMLSGQPPFFNKNQKIMLQNRIFYKIPYPNHFDETTVGFLKKLLESDVKIQQKQNWKPLKRLTDPKMIKSDPFFVDINFHQIKRRIVKPPTQKEIIYNLTPRSGRIVETYETENSRQVHFSNYTYEPAFKK